MSPSTGGLTSSGTTASGPVSASKGKSCVMSSQPAAAYELAMDGCEYPVAAPTPATHLMSNEPPSVRTWPYLERR